MTNPAENIRQVVEDFIKHNTKVHAIKFSVFPRVHEQRRKQFKQYLYNLDKEYRLNRAKAYRRFLKEARTSITDSTHE